VVVVRFKQWYEDIRLTWNPADYGGIKTTRMNTNINGGGGLFIWSPDICGYELGGKLNFDDLMTERA